jgi:integrase
MFRHTVASLINKETGIMKLSQAQLGHANVQITADVYTHVDETQKRKSGGGSGTGRSWKSVSIL